MVLNASIPFLKHESVKALTPPSFGKPFGFFSGGSAMAAFARLLKELREKEADAQEQEDIERAKRDSLDNGSAVTAAILSVWSVSRGCRRPTASRR